MGVQAMVVLGGLLMQWEPPDPTAAHAWLTKAATAGHPVAVTMLRESSGKGSIPDDEQRCNDDQRQRNRGDAADH